MSKKVKQHLKRCNDAITSGDFESALNEVEAALSIESTNYTANIFKGKIFTEQKNYRAGEKIYENLIQSEKDKILAYKEMIQK
jgi:lipopolysaccharide biosynthesis regulator YciM